MDELLDAFFEKTFEDGEVVMSQGDTGDNFYILDQGICEIFVKVKGEDKLVFTAKPGNGFGELALLYNAPRAATVKCRGAVHVFGLDRDSFTHILRSTESNKQELYCGFLEKVDILSALDAEERAKLADVLVSKTFKEGEYIIRQGEEGDFFYIVAKGQAVATKS
eukprot:CAMPEP_0175976912 /NCGR_PEP_ID=MMETSP0108-20121206/44786_1 /TAXON_ID=195067 ORGANISM="Goniomonas pacifica, Strain CCMP1869" /NCGR_SAMPLE_ID=MMETSP0108 /ASSEMBLY_ACC=CAM_ASM_000204 /LENGTH=164 /DNA_ID=CAMNT_0017306869 /DNA_START=3 /DNA_END=494 /DNA_ORIENTATION=+